MKCIRCGHANPERARFCLECGAPVTRGCASCGTELPLGAKFCLECGTAVAGATPGTSTTVAPERVPLPYTPKHLADKILQSRSALEGERKQVASETNSEFNRVNTLRNLFAAYAAGEDWDRAELTLADAANIGFKRPSPWIAGLHFARGRVADAIAAADECIANGDSALERAQAHLQRARIRLRADGAAARADVEADHAAVLALIDSRGIEGIRPELHEWRAELARVLGDDAAALHELREAHRLNAAMGASGHAARLARELGL